jgi:hypothetical protein
MMNTHTNTYGVLHVVPVFRLWSHCLVLFTITKWSLFHKSLSFHVLNLVWSTNYVMNKSPQNTKLPKNGEPSKDACFRATCLCIWDFGGCFFLHVAWLACQIGYLVTLIYHIEPSIKIFKHNKIDTSVYEHTILHGSVTCLEMSVTSYFTS